MNAQNLAAKIVGVGGGFLGVPRFAAGAFIDGAVAIGFARMCVVAGGGVQVAGGVKGERSSRMAALVALSLDAEENFFARHVQRSVAEGEAGDPVLADLVVGVVGVGLWVGVEEVDPRVFCELGIQRDAEQTVFQFREHLECAGDG